MPGLTYNTAAGDLTIGGVAMFCPGWRVLNLMELWLPAKQRGRDVTVPGVAGVSPRKRVDTATTRSLQLHISGEYGRTGTAATDYFETLQANLDYLRANVVAPTGATDGTRSAVLTMPDGTSRTEPVHVTGMDVGKYHPAGRWALAVIELSIPSGRIQ